MNDRVKVPRPGKLELFQPPPSPTEQGPTTQWINMSYYDVKAVIARLPSGATAMAIYGASNRDDLAGPLTRSGFQTNKSNLWVRKVAEPGQSVAAGTRRIFTDLLDHFPNARMRNDVLIADVVAKNKAAPGPQADAQKGQGAPSAAAPVPAPPRAAPSSRFARVATPETSAAKTDTPTQPLDAATSVDQDGRQQPAAVTQPQPEIADVPAQPADTAGAGRDEVRPDGGAAASRPIPGDRGADADGSGVADERDRATGADAGGAAANEVQQGAESDRGTTQPGDGLDAVRGPADPPPADGRVGSGDRDEQSRGGTGIADDAAGLISTPAGSPAETTADAPIIPGVGDDPEQDGAATREPAPAASPSPAPAPSLEDVFAALDAAEDATAEPPQVPLTPPATSTEIEQAEAEVLAKPVAAPPAPAVSLKDVFEGLDDVENGRASEVMPAPQSEQAPVSPAESPADTGSNTLAPDVANAAANADPVPTSEVNAAPAAIDTDSAASLDGPDGRMPADEPLDRAVDAALDQQGAAAAPQVESEISEGASKPEDTPVVLEAPPEPLPDTRFQTLDSHYAQIFVRPTGTTPAASAGSASRDISSALNGSLDTLASVIRRNAEPEPYEIHRLAAYPGLSHSSLAVAYLVDSDAAGSYAQRLASLSSGRMQGPAPSGEANAVHNALFQPSTLNLNNLWKQETVAAPEIGSMRPTPPALADALWEAATRSGFRGGALLAPAAGTGLLLGRMPRELQADVTAIEADALTSEIHKRLHPYHTVLQEDLMAVKTPRAAFAAVIGELPEILSNQETPNDADANSAVLRKMLDSLADGGVAAVVVPRSVMDQANPVSRRKIADDFDLLVAQRLPVDSFAGIANSDLVRDMLVFRKPVAGEDLNHHNRVDRIQPDRWAEATWNSPATEAKTIALGNVDDKKYTAREDVVKAMIARQNNESSYVNDLFVRSPGNVVGTMKWQPLQTTAIQVGFKQPVPGKPSKSIVMQVATPPYTLDVIAPQHAANTTLRSSQRPLVDQAALLGSLKARLAEAPLITAYAPGDTALTTGGSQAIDPIDTMSMDDARPFRRALPIESFVLVDAELMVIKPDGVRPPNGKMGRGQEKMLRDMVPLRDAALDVLHAQYTAAPIDVINETRARLNEVYDGFVKKNGPVSSDKVVRLIECDPSFPVMLSLETFDDKTGKATKNAIFSTRVFAAPDVDTSPMTALRAMHMSLGEFHRIDPSYIENMLERPWREIRADLSGQIFENPESGQWETAATYLSGDVIAKVSQAKEYDRLRPGRYQENIAALEKALPAQLSRHEITPKLGANWLPASVPYEYISHLSKLSLADVQARISIEYVGETREWVVQDKSASHKKLGAIDANDQFKTERVGALEVLRDVMNNRFRVITDPAPTATQPDRRKNNTQETALAQAAARRMADHFERWVYEDNARAEMLVELYNERYNRLVLPKFNGEMVKPKGLAAGVVLATHQLEAVARNVTMETALNAHCVGSGKTLVAITTAMELKRVGKATLPVLTTLRPLTHQHTAEALKFYPAARVLLCTESDMATDRARKRFADKARLGDWDLVVMSHDQWSSFKLGAGNPIHKLTLLKLDFEEKLMRAARQNDSTRRMEILERELRAVNRELVTLRSKQASITGNQKDAKAVPYEMLGIDFILIDEAHLFKNTGFETRLSNVRGLHPEGSDRALEAKAKADWTRLMRATKRGVEPGDAGGVVTLTGTPITNSMGEMWSMGKLTVGRPFKEFGIESFDEWVSTFGKTTISLEQSADGSTFKPVTRLAQFHNLAEMIYGFRMYADVKRRQDINLPVPTMTQYNIVSPLSPEQKLIKKALALRCANLNSHSEDKDNVLAVMSDFSLAMLDQRGIHPAFGEHPQSRSALCAEKAHEIWRDTADTKATQLIFVDRLVPSNVTFSIYKDIADKLVARGVPRNEIAFVQDAKDDASRERLFESVRRGDIRFLMGSTERLGTGVNVQDRLIAVHEVDAPWRPTDMEQREGRAVRRDNMHDNVMVFLYTTEGYTREFDLLRTKAGFIAQALANPDPSMRRMEEEVDPRWAEIMAMTSDNELFKEKFQLDQAVQTLTFEESAHKALLARATKFLDPNSWMEKDYQKGQRAIAALNAATEAMKAAMAEHDGVLPITPLYVPANAAAEIRLLKDQPLTDGDKFGAWLGAVMLEDSVNRYTPVAEVAGQKLSLANYLERARFEGGLAQQSSLFSKYRRTLSGDTGSAISVSAPDGTETTPESHRETIGTLRFVDLEDLDNGLPEQSIKSVKRVLDNLPGIIGRLEGRVEMLTRRSQDYVEERRQWSEVIDRGFDKADELARLQVRLAQVDAEVAAYTAQHQLDPETLMEVAPLTHLIRHNGKSVVPKRIIPEEIREAPEAIKAAHSMVNRALMAQSGTYSELDRLAMEETLKDPKDRNDDLFSTPDTELLM